MKLHHFYEGIKRIIPTLLLFLDIVIVNIRSPFTLGMRVTDCNISESFLHLAYNIMSKGIRKNVEERIRVMRTSYSTVSILILSYGFTLLIYP